MSISELERQPSLFYRCQVCGSLEVEPVACIPHKPVAEKPYGEGPEAYPRHVYKCLDCSVYLNFPTVELKLLYKSDYHLLAHGNIHDRYLCVRSLPDGESHNKGRVRRVLAFVRSLGWEPSQRSVLDVGSGLCVFLAELKDLGFQCFCVDPDAAAVEHALENVKVDGAYECYFEDFEAPQQFDLISFVNVLEHVEDPVKQLSKGRDSLTPNGTIYVEVPDGENAARHGSFNRQEFFLEHYTVFTPEALYRCAALAGLEVVELGRVHEPSDIYVMYAFLK